MTYLSAILAMGLMVSVAGAEEMTRAFPQSATPAALDQPGYDRASREWRTIADADPESMLCRDAIRKARATGGLPALDRRPASPDEPLFVKAVDMRIENCPVLVMARDTNDIRPVPAPRTDRARLIPAAPRDKSQ